MTGKSLSLNPLGIVLAMLFSSACPQAQADTLVTVAENPKVVNSTLSNTQVFDFNNLSTGLNKNVFWSDVGMFDKLYIKTADQYGGAVDAAFPNGSKYSVQGVGTSVSTTTLSLNESSSYFGFWWSAGDASNRLDFYSGDTLVMEYTTQSLLGLLPNSYLGNPRNQSLDSHEPFAFINFYGDADTSWDKVVFSNTTNSGFESDNYTSRVLGYVPELDGPNIGTPVAIVDGKTTTKVTSLSQVESISWAHSAAPGAPVPPIPLLIAFGCVALLRTRRSPHTVPSLPLP